MQCSLREQYLRGEATEEAKPEVHHGEGKVLVEEVAEETAHAQVGPAPVHQQEALQEAELGEGVVTGQNGLDALLPRDPHSNVGACRSVHTHGHGEMRRNAFWGFLRDFVSVE